MASSTKRAIRPDKKEELVRAFGEYEGLSNETLRREILQNNRFDLLAEYVLGIELEQVHRELIAYALEHPESLHLAFRGCGKTTSFVCPYIVGRLLQDPELCILIGSRAGQYAKAILKEVKGHLVNERLVRIFGEQVGEKWEETEIVIAGKKRNTKEASVTALGAEGSMTGRHFDIIFFDDGVDLANSRTRGQRDKIKDFYYTTLDPCLKPGGERKVVGTRYHPHDLYGWLAAHEFARCTQILPALHEVREVDGSVTYYSSAPKRFTVEYLLDKRSKIPSFSWVTQFQCTAQRFQGKVFKPEYFESEDFFFTGPLPAGSVFQSVDPAATEDKKNDCFAHMTGAVDGDGHVWIDSYHNIRIEFPKQSKFCHDEFEEADPVRLGFENNAYQRALGQQIIADYPDLKGKVIGVPTDKDKDTRALKLTAYFEAGRIHFRPEHKELIEQLLEFPDGEHDDLFDALYILVLLGTRMRVKKKRRKEPDVL